MNRKIEISVFLMIIGSLGTATYLASEHRAKPSPTVIENNTIDREPPAVFKVGFEAMIWIKDDGEIWINWDRVAEVAKDKSYSNMPISVQDQAKIMLAIHNKTYKQMEP